MKLAKRVLSLPSQVTMFKDLIAAEKSVQDMERKAFRMDAEEQGQRDRGAARERSARGNENPALGRALWGYGWSVDFNSIIDARLFTSPSPASRARRTRSRRPRFRTRPPCSGPSRHPTAFRRSTGKRNLPPAVL